MKTLTALITSTILSSVISCTNNSATQSKTSKSNTLKHANIANANASPESLPGDAVTGFLKWYSHHKNSLDSISVVNNANEEVYDSTKFYSVNFEATEKYLRGLKESGYVSKEYLNYWRKYFKQAEDQFKANPQNDGPPGGFEYDFVLLSQDVDKDLANTNKAKVVSNVIQNSKATVVLQMASGQKLRYFLSKQAHSWQIDKVEQANG